MAIWWRPWADPSRSGSDGSRELIRRYGAAVLLALAALVLRIGLGALIGTRAPYVTFFVALMISAAYGGFGPGLLTTVLGTVLARTFVNAGTGFLGMIDPSDPTGFMRFVGLGVGMSYICGLLVTAREHAEDSEKSERLARLLMEQTLAGLSDAVISTDTGGHIQYINAAAERLLGRSSVVSRGLKIDAVVELENERLSATVIEVIRAHTVLPLGADARLRVEGRALLVEGSAAPVGDEGGNVAGVVILIRDITERKEADALLASQAEELRRSNRELEEFAYVVSHDLQEPLRMVSTYTELLLRRIGDLRTPEVEPLAGVVRDGILRMNRLIHDLLGYSRTAHSGARASFIDPRGAIDQALTVCRPLITEAAATVKVGDLPTVLAQETLLVQVFQNLISNAVKYRKQEGVPEIIVSAVRQGDEVLFSVTDNGIGFDQKYAARVFGLFKRLHTTEYPGTGAGLAITKRIIERFNGRIWAESKLGAGSTFYFTLPAARAKAPETSGKTVAAK